MALAYAPIFLWIAVIFFLSSNNGSTENTSRIIGPILRFLFPSAAPDTIDLYHWYIRKGAHLSEYFVLGWLGARAVRAFFLVVKPVYWLIPVAIVLSVASLDEFNQSFDPARTSSPRDVLIDLTGGSVAVLIVALWSRYRSKRTKMDG